MFSCEEFQIIKVSKKSLSNNELQLTEKYTINTIGEIDARDNLRVNPKVRAGWLIHL